MAVLQWTLGLCVCVCVLARALCAALSRPLRPGTTHVGGKLLIVKDVSTALFQEDRSVDCNNSYLAQFFLIKNTISEEG